MFPFAYGGPSCRMYLGRPARDCRIWPYKSSVSQAASIFGSATGRFAFIGKSVRGRLIVCFTSRFLVSIGVLTIVTSCSCPHCRQLLHHAGKKRLGVAK